ncbi:glycosyltransferase family 2 protein [Amphritea sp. HPY]|uniref:glycosyltransferase family 2 protein n=1 Tax=Amphritea sp. HPY TaxID=3421652 RepID=UPI003D7D1C1B
MRISIAMATYNGAKFLEEQLNSFLDQTRLPDELIITDDCSSDETEEIIVSFTQTAPFKVIFSRNNKNLGYCANFNAALMKTTGDLVFLSDQDDVWFPEKIEHMIAVVEKHPEALVVMNDAALTDEGLNEVGVTKLGQIKSMGLSVDSFIMGCCCAARRELLDLCLPISEDYNSHDRWIVKFADGLNAKIVDRRVLQYYRRHENNESQFIANRTSKVTKWHRYIQVMVKSYKSDVAVYDGKLEQQVLLLKGINRAAENNDKYRSEFAIMRQDAEKIVFRLKIRKNNFAKRVLAAFSHFVFGGDKDYRIRSLVMDILG